MKKQFYINHASNLNCYWNISNTNFSLPLVLNSWLRKKLEILIYPQKLRYAGHEISVNQPVFLNIKLDRNKAISIFVANSWIIKIELMYRWRLSNQKSNKFAYLIRTNYVNIKYIQHIWFINQNAPCNFNNDKVQQAIEPGWLRIINNKPEVK